MKKEREREKAGFVVRYHTLKSAFPLLLGKKKQKKKLLLGCFHTTDEENGKLSAFFVKMFIFKSCQEMKTEGGSWHLT